MRNWRVLVAIAAVVLAGVAAYLSYEYAHKADSRAEKNVQRVNVLVAKNDIAKGVSATDALNSGLITTKQVPRNVLPPTAVANATDLSNKVALATISKGQFIVSGSFVEAAQVGGFSSTVPKGHQAITISVDQTHGVAGFVTPGDLVNVIYTGPVTQVKNPLSAGSNKLTAFLVPSVRVLAVGATTATSTSGSTGGTGLNNSGNPAGANTPSSSSSANASSGLITLDVTPRQAEQIAQGVSMGSFYLTLDAPGLDPSKFAPPTEIVDTWNLFDQPLNELGAARAAAPTAH